MRSVAPSASGESRSRARAHRRAGQREHRVDADGAQQRALARHVRAAHDEHRGRAAELTSFATRRALREQRVRERLAFEAARPCRPRTRGRDRPGARRRSRRASRAPRTRRPPSSQLRRGAARTRRQRSIANADLRRPRAEAATARTSKVLAASPADRSGAAGARFAATAAARPTSRVASQGARAAAHENTLALEAREHLGEQRRGPCAGLAGADRTCATRARQHGDENTTRSRPTTTEGIRETRNQRPRRRAPAIARAASTAAAEDGGHRGRRRQRRVPHLDQRGPD